MPLIKLSIAAERLGVSNANLRARVAAGSLAVERCPCGREWMVEEAEVDRYARENRRTRVVPVAPETELERAATRGCNHRPPAAPSPDTEEKA